VSKSESSKKGFVAPTPKELDPLFPAYKVTAFIAQGGMGAVYEAHQESLDRPVAIKILPREFGSDASFRAKFEAEAKAMARLNHPNLIAVYDFGDVDGMLYIVIELVQGKALYYSVHGKSIDPSVTCEIISQVCRGLAHAHKEGILHRDIKSANIMLGPDARPKIGDFGLARPLENQRKGGVIYSTPGYTAPEVLGRGLVDQRSDIFSVGAMMYEMVGGKIPKPETSSMTTGVCDPLDEIIEKATHFIPDFRFIASRLHFADDIGVAIEGQHGDLVVAS